jgi:hypothetical protein
MPEPVQVVKSTSSRVWFMCHDWGDKPVERMSNKVSEYARFFETEAEAVEYLRNRIAIAIDNLARQLNDERSRLGELKKKYGLPQ